MKFKLIFLSLLLPVLALISIVAGSVFLKDYYIDLVIDLAYTLSYIIVILVAIKICDVHFNSRNWFPDPKQVLISILLAFALFGCFYLEKVILGTYTKGIFTWYQILSTVLIAPVLEEFFSKVILMDNLRKIIHNKFWVILIIALYFWILHFPTLMATHFIFGLTTAYLYYNNKNLFQVILIHILYNALIVLFHYY